MPRRRLQVESAARVLAAAVYRATSAFPSEELFGLTRELRRSAVSVGSNVAEGAGRSSEKEFARFLDIAVGSGRELRFQLELALDLELADPPVLLALIDENDRLSAMLETLRHRLLR